MKRMTSPPAAAVALSPPPKSPRRRHVDRVSCEAAKPERGTHPGACAVQRQNKKWLVTLVIPMSLIDGG